MIMWMFKLFSRFFVAGIVIAALSLLIIVLDTDPTRYVFKDSSWDTPETAGIFTVGGLRTSLYGRLTGAHDVDYLRITVTKPTDISIALRTVAGDPSFNPEIIVFGRGLAPRSDVMLPIGDENGAVVGRIGEKTRGTVFDITTMTSYTEGPTVTTRLPEAGTYAIAILTPNGSTGRYVLSTGTKPDRSFDGWISSLRGAVQVILRLY